MVGDLSYYVKTAVANQAVALRVDANTGQFMVEAKAREVQHLAIKGIRQWVRACCPLPPL